MFLLCAGGQHALEIARENVDLYIELLPGLQRAECSVGRSVRDDVDGEMRAAVLSDAHVVDGPAGSGS